MYIRDKPGVRLGALPTAVTPVPIWTAYPRRTGRMADGPVPSNSGTSLRDLQRAFDELVGPAGTARALERLSVADRAEIEHATAVSWVPATTVGRWIDAVVAESGEAEAPLLDAAVRLATTHAFKTVWRALFHFTSDEALVRRTPAIYARSRNVGRLVVAEVVPGRADLRLEGWPGVSRRQLRAIAVSIATIVELCGRGGVEVTERVAPDGGSFRVRWTP